MNIITNNYLMLLNKLDPQQKPLWGKMTPQHMVEHLILAVQMSNGKLTLECFNPPEKIPSLKRFLMSSRPMPKLFVNPVIGEALRPLEYSSFEEAIEKLKKEIDVYILFFENNPDAKQVNVTFGELNKEEWNVFHKKHFRHHLTQFGLL
jgi:hydroxymethylglutaryl-CoA reductase/oxepin-CoA hydrolase/3-oxo-5,6-dehydrosuberyl-CoA semialdehyde dehydrogenase